MDYKGVIIEESLRNKEILKGVTILNTKIEVVTDHHKTPWLRQWTLHTVEIPEDMADSFAEKMSKAIDTEHTSWYADYKNDKYHFIIYADKIFKVDLENPILYRNAKDYGVSIGIPEYQVDFAPEDKVWER